MSKLTPMTGSARTADLTPRWRGIRRDHLEIHAVLQQVAQAVYEQGEGPADSEIDWPGLQAAAELGFLKTGGDGNSFVDPEVRRDYLIRHAADVALMAWEEPRRFADAIDEAQRRVLGYAGRREATAAVLLILAQEHGKDVVGRVGELARMQTESRGSNRLLWDVYSPFCEALPELEIEPAQLAQALEAVSEATANDGMAGSVYNAIERLASRSRAQGEALHEVFASRPDSPRFAFVPAILVGLARIDLGEAHRLALDLSTAAEPASRRVGIAALGLMDYSGEDHGLLLDATWERFEHGRSEPDPEIDHTLVRAYGNLVGRKPQAKEALAEFSARQDSNVRGPLSWILFQNSDEAHDESWFREALLNLADVPTSHAGVLENLDHSLYRVATEDPGLAVEFMEAIVLGRDYGEDDESGELPEMLPGAFSELAQHHPVAIEETVTRWFASSERRLHRAARDVVHETYDISGRSPPWLRLSKAVLDVLEEQTVVYALQRIMGHVMGSRALAALLLSAARREPCSQAFLDFVAGALGGYVLYNYPHEAGDYLRGTIEADDVPGAEAEVVRIALEQSEAYLAAPRDLPLMKEFQPSSQHQYLLRLAEHRQQTGMMDEAKRSSVLLNIMPELPLKYGRSHFMERDGDFTQPEELVPFSIAAEKPRAEILDPIGSMFTRLGWQSAGLGEGNDAENMAQGDERDDEVAGR
jgi:hypothetical protein